MDSNIYNPTNGQSPLQEFYKNSKILITGGTGFIGKVLAEKLLRSYLTVSTIYLLVRPKRGRNVEQRIQALLDNSVRELTCVLR